MTKHTKHILIIVIIGAVIVYFIFFNKKNAATPTATAVTPTDPSQPAAVSQPAPISQQPPGTIQGNPVVMGSTPTVFAPTVTDAEVQGNSANQVSAPNMPAGFQSWYNSLGPQNKARVAAAYSTMTADEINMINNMVINNLWGSASMAPAWNAFVLKYGLPVRGLFSNFSGGSKLQKNAIKLIK